MPEFEEMTNIVGAEKLVSLDLPKWPQMCVAGPSVSPEQASEIIRRTDTFITHGYDGNDRRWNAHAKSLIGMPEKQEIVWPGDDATDDERAAFRARLDTYWDEERNWRKEWGAIETGYVHNSWISCSFIGGPHGWCSPTGEIYFRDNVGKWPSPEEVVKDWAILAQAFPFIDLEVVFMSGEGCEDTTGPVFGLLVRGGTVEVFLPREREFGAGDYAWDSRGSAIEDAIATLRFPARIREVGVTEEMISGWASAHRQKMLLKEASGG